MDLRLKLFFFLFVAALAYGFPKRGESGGKILVPDNCMGEVLESPRTDEQDRNKRNAITENKRWPNATIPYAFSDEPQPFTDADLQDKLKAMALWEKHTCLKFRPATSDDQNYIVLRNEGCKSYVGMIGGTQNMSIGCKGVHDALHELGHVIGLFHEHQRPDRDDWVTVHFENIKEGTNVPANFQKRSSEEVDTYNYLYDYLSIMQYGGMTLSKGSVKVIVAKDPYFQRLLGYHETPSFRNYRLVNKMYSCYAQCPAQSCDGEGFVGKDCKCWCPGNPIQLCGAPYEEPEATKCQDKDSLCEWWAQQGECEQFAADYVGLICPVSCTLCNPNSNCTNYDGNCDYYAHTGWCESHQEYMQSTCPRSCRLCDPL